MSEDNDFLRDDEDDLSVASSDSPVKTSKKKRTLEDDSDDSFNASDDSEVEAEKPKKSAPKKKTKESGKKASKKSDWEKKKRRLAEEADDYEDDGFIVHDELNSDDEDDGDRRKKKSKKGKLSKKAAIRLFDEEAQSDDDEDEDLNMPAEVEHLDEEELSARRRVEERHAYARRMHEISDAELASRYEVRNRAERQIEKSVSTGLLDTSTAAFAQQARLPTIRDPKIFKLRCREKMEHLLVRAILLKAHDMQKREGIMRIKSVFSTGTPGYLYVESISEVFVKEVLTGQKNVYLSQLVQVPLADMPSLLNVTVQKKPMKVGQMVRMKRGPYGGDLARIVEISAGEKALVQLIPRIDYQLLKDPSSRTKKTQLGESSMARPPQRLWDLDLAESTGIEPKPQDHGTILWNGQEFRDGFLLLEQPFALLISEGVNPRLEELRLFEAKNKTNAGAANTNNEEDESESLNGNGTTILQRDLNNLLGTDSDKSLATFVPGDLVKVTGGELASLIARIVSLDEVAGSAKVKSLSAAVAGEFTVELSLLMKYVHSGSHVKVLSGQFAGQTGRVVTTQPNGIAILLTDGFHTEISCNVALLQLSDEVATGAGDLMGYELYDLVSLNDTESAVVINVGVERLRVLNHLGQTKDIAPQEVRAKLNQVSARQQSHDIQQNKISVGDSVHVSSGPQAKLSGTVKHINRGTIWLYSPIYMVNSGVFVVKGRNCVLAGGVSNSGAKAFPLGGPPTTDSFTRKPAAGRNTPSGGPGGLAAQARNDRSKIGMTVKITQGKHRGLLAQITNATATDYNVELLAKLQKVVVRHEQVVFIGDRTGKRTETTPAGTVPGSSSTTSAATSFDNSWFGSSSSGAASSSTGFDTPFWGGGSQTPFMSTGSETPFGTMGSETPHFGSMTPRAYDADSLFAVGGNDGSATPAYGSATPAGFSTPAILSSTASKLSSENLKVGALVTVTNADNSVCKGVVSFVRPNAVEVNHLDHTGQRSQDADLHEFHQLELVPPQKNSQILVTSGKHSGSYGIVKSVMGSELAVQLDGAGRKLDMIPVSICQSVYERAVPPPPPM